MVETALKQSQKNITREQLKRMLKVKIMHQTLNLILSYLEEKNLIIDSHKGISWVHKSVNQVKQEIFDWKAELKKILPIIKKILKKEGVKKAGIFGSYVRGEATQESDIDILVEFKKKISLFDLVGIEGKLNQATGKKVELVTYKSLNPLIKETVLKEEKKII